MFIDELKKFLKEGNDWEKIATDIKSVFIVKVPAPKNSKSGPRLMIEINPVDEAGKPKKKKGLFISDKETYIQYLEALEDDKINKVIDAIESINPKVEKKIKKINID
ncbi:MAG: hypothetical protein ACTSVC_15585 [Promethearchaeota archaeon]